MGGAVVGALLVARLLLARDPLGHAGRGLLVAAGALALFVLWTRVSAAWSDAGWRAAIEADRAALYLGVRLLLGTWPGPRGPRRRPTRSAWCPTRPT